MTYANIKILTKTVYILCIYTYKARFCQKIGFILGRSLGDLWVILGDT